MQYEITQIISYLVTADTQQDAIDIFKNHPRTQLMGWKEGDIELYDERIEVNP